MNKSDKLDELRLEVGMIADKVTSRIDFYRGVIHTIGKNLPEQFGVAIYQCDHGFFQFLTGYGNLSQKKLIKFGDGMFSMCSIRGKVIVHIEDDIIQAFAPYYNGHHLVGILYAQCDDSSYHVSEDEIIFLQEITRFMEVKGKLYEKPKIDNI